MKQTWGAKHRRSASWSVRFPGTHYLYNLDTLYSVLSSNITIRSASRYLHISGSSEIYNPHPMLLLVNKRGSPHSIHLTVLLLSCSRLILLATPTPLGMFSRGRLWNLRSGEEGHHHCVLSRLCRRGLRLRPPSLYDHINFCVKTLDRSLKSQHIHLRACPG